jgi:hypothetical protein
MGKKPKESVVVLLHVLVARMEAKTVTAITMMGVAGI